MLRVVSCLFLLVAWARAAQIFVDGSGESDAQKIMRRATKANGGGTNIGVAIDSDGTVGGNEQEKPHDEDDEDGVQECASAEDICEGLVKCTRGCPCPECKPPQNEEEDEVEDAENAEAENENEEANNEEAENEEAENENEEANNEEAQNEEAESEEAENEEAENEDAENEEAESEEAENENEEAKNEEAAPAAPATAPAADKDRGDIWKKRKCESRASKGKCGVKKVKKNCQETCKASGQTVIPRASEAAPATPATAPAADKDRGDIWKKSKCESRARKGKCKKKNVKKNCQETCKA